MPYAALRLQRLGAQLGIHLALTVRAVIAPTSLEHRLARRVEAEPLSGDAAWSYAERVIGNAHFRPALSFERFDIGVSDICDPHAALPAVRGVLDRHIANPEDFPD